MIHMIQELSGRTLIVEHENNWLEAKAVELADLLCCQLMGTLAGKQDRPAIRCRQGSAEGRRRGPTDRTPQSLVLERRSL